MARRVAPQVSPYSVYLNRISSQLDKSKKTDIDTLVVKEKAFKGLVTRCLNSLQINTVSTQQQDENTKALYQSLKSRISKIDSDTCKHSLQNLLHEINNRYTFEIEPTALVKAPKEPLATVPTGSQNQSGSDCFVNAFYQFVQHPALFANFVNQLPKELWEVFATDQPDATQMRYALKHYTGFAAGVNGGAGQQDATEVLGHLCDRLYKADNSYLPPPPLNPVQIVLPELKFARKDYTMIGCAIRIIDCISYVLMKIAEAFARLGNYLSKEEEPTEVSSIPEERKTLRKKRIISKSVVDSPLNICLTQKTITTPNKDWHKTIQHLDDFGGPDNISENTPIPEPYLPLSLIKKTENGPYNFSDIFEDHFKDVQSTFTKTVKDGELQGVYEAPFIKTTRLKKAPEHLLLSFKRMHFDLEKNKNVKITDPIENIPLEYTLPAGLGAGEKKYELGSFLTHIGSASAGHYVCYRKINDKWFLFNDSVVTEIKEDKEILNAVKHAYVIFYSGKASA